MTVRPKLRATLVQHFGSPRLDEPVSSTVSGLGDEDDPGARLTAHHLSSPHDDGDHLPLEGDVVGGCYRLVSRLGEGMFGRVYVAERTDVPEHRVALKVMTRAVYAGRNVERELVMLAAATHPNIVQLKDHGVTGEYVWLTMPLYDGETLAERLDRGPLGLREAYELFLPIARGMQALHARGLRHQDIKPENIFLADFADRVHPVLLDLGVAVECNATFVAGTALYCAPEQIVALGGLAGRAKLSEKMDTYCLASTLLRSLVGPEHFAGEEACTPFDIANAFEERELVPLCDEALLSLGGEARRLLSEALSRWLTRDADERPSIKQMAEELDVLLEQEREAARAIQRNIERQKAAYRRVRIAFGAVALIGAGAVLFGYSKRETLRLAGELDRAKAEGVASFDKLDTCVAAHRIADNDAKNCLGERSKDEDRFTRSLTSLVTSNERTHEEVSTRLEATSARAYACEADATQAAEDHSTQVSTLTEDLSTKTTAWNVQRTELASARDRSDEKRRQCEGRLATTTNSQSHLREDLAACITDRDTCMASDEPPLMATPVSGPENVDPAVPATEPAAPSPKEADSAPSL
jgi:serine/threonine protein kinase